MSSTTACRFLVFLMCSIQRMSRLIYPTDSVLLAKDFQYSQFRTVNNPVILAMIAKTTIVVG